MIINIEINCQCNAWESFLKDAEQIIEESSKRIFNNLGIDKNINNIEISVLLTDNDSIKVLNNDYRKQDKPTNVLSFPNDELSSDSLDDLKGDLILGDLAFAFETIQNEAKDDNKKLSHHFTHLAIHGVLHLLGHDHLEEDEAHEMEALEVSILKDMGIKDPYFH